MTSDAQDIHRASAGAVSLHVVVSPGHLWGTAATRAQRQPQRPRQVCCGAATVCLCIGDVHRGCYTWLVADDASRVPFPRYIFHEIHMPGTEPVHTAITET